MSIYRGQGGAPSATDSISLNRIIQLETDAGISASDASASAAAADASATAAGISETNSAGSEASTAADALATAADVVLTHADVVLTNADAATTAANVILTDASAIAAGLDAVATEADAIATAADAAQTALDVIATSADAASTAIDASTASTAASNASISETNAGISETNALASEVAAAASAATIPAYEALVGNALNLVRLNATEDTMEFRTPAQVLSDINATGKTSDTGSAILPAGTTAQRDGTAFAGYFRYNNDLSAFEGYNGTSWGSVGGGATGGGADEVFVENDQVVTTDYTIPVGRNAMSTGDITINTGVTVTVSTGSNWVVI